MKPLLLCLLLTTFLTSLAQIDREVGIPIEVTKTYKDINIKFIFQEVDCGSNYCNADLVIGFENPNTFEWVYFEMKDIGFFGGGFHEFVITVQNIITKPKDLKFIEHILDKESEGRYRWRCRLNEMFSTPEM